MNNFINIILLSRKRNFSYNIKLSFRLIAILFVIFIIVTVLTLILLFSNARTSFEKMSLLKIEKENRAFVKRLDSLKLLLQHTQNKFEDNIAQDNRQRTFLGMAFIHSDIWSMGIGGKKFDSPGEYLSIHTSRALDEIYEAIDILHGQFNLRKRSLDDINNIYENKLNLWAHIPSTNPIPNCPLGSGFGYRVDPINGSIRMHWGVDIGAPRGTPIHATADGIVFFAGWNMGLGLTIEIEHGYGFVSRYAHCSAILVNQGQFVKRGQVIALVGSTGRTTSPHLHYEVDISGVKVNPTNYIDTSNIVFD